MPGVISKNVSHGKKSIDEDLFYNMSGDKFLIIVEHPGIVRSATKDGERLKDVFYKLGFKIFVLRDLEYHKIIFYLTAVATLNHSRTACICIAILTHGAEGGLLFAAEKPYPLKKLETIFEKKGLANKPKIYVVQTWKGAEEDPDCYFEIDGDTALRSGVHFCDSLGDSGYGNVAPGDTDAARKKETKADCDHVPSHADIFILSASIKGSVSDHCENGTPMIQELCNIMENNADEMHFADMVTIIADLVKDDNSAKQIVINSSLRRRVQFRVTYQ